MPLTRLTVTALFARDGRAGSSTKTRLRFVTGFMSSSPSRSSETARFLPRVARFGGASSPPSAVVGVAVPLDVRALKSGAGSGVAALDGGGDGLRARERVSRTMVEGGDGRCGRKGDQARSLISAFRGSTASTPVRHAPRTRAPCLFPSSSLGVIVCRLSIASRCSPCMDMGICYNNFLRLDVCEQPRHSKCSPSDACSLVPSIQRGTKVYLGNTISVLR
jgi:hypothetical protein